MMLVRTSLLSCRKTGGDLSRTVSSSSSMSILTMLEI